MQRRTFLKASSLTLMGAGGVQAIPTIRKSPEKIQPAVALNAYSFNRLLRDQTMSLDDLFQFARKTGFAGVDLTAYYIPGYPDVPGDEVLFQIKKNAFRLGLAISGTGVRNDFTLSDQEALSGQIALVKNWIVAASKLGAPHLRVFDGKGEGVTGPRKGVIKQVIDSFQECADFATEYGITVAFQNHKEYIKSTTEVLEVLKGVHSDWFGLMLDIGSITGTKPYEDIRKLIPNAVSWQVKTNLFGVEGKPPVDFTRFMKIVLESGYTGFFPLETLGEGDPYKKVQGLFERVDGELG